MNFYIGGFTWGDESKLEEFLSESVWINGYQEVKYFDLFNSIKVGDFFALKSTFVKGRKPNAKSYLRIKKIGVVAKILDKQSISIKWINSISEFDLTDIKWYANTLEKIHIEFDINKIFGHAINTISMNDYKELLNHKKQIILQGPPGTGKTYTSKDIAEEMIFGGVSEDKKAQKKRLEESEQFELVQFHPSYSYEDFVRGISAKASDRGIEYKVEDKVLAKFAKEANDNYEEKPSLDREEWTKKKFVKYKGYLKEKLESKSKVSLNNSDAYVKEIDDDFLVYYSDKYSESGSGFKLNYDTFLDIHLSTDYNTEYTDYSFNDKFNIPHRNIYVSLLYDFRNFAGEFNLESKMNYVLIIDEINRANLPSVLGELIYALEYRGEKVSTMYEKDGDSSIIIPENLFIIGTMNTADRSVGSIDYAIKRRFAFKSILPNVDVIENQKAKELFEIVSELFVKEEEKEGEIVKSNSIYLASDFDYQDVQIGHSYFMLKEGSEEKQNTELKLRLEYEILPLLYEYVKDGLLMEKAKEYIKNKIKPFGLSLN